LPRSKRAKAKRARGRRTRSTKRRNRYSKAVLHSWYEGKSFTTDWTSWKLPFWTRLLAPYQKRRLDVLEIGSWEGRSAIFFANFFPRAHIVCVDTFGGGQEHQLAARRSRWAAGILRTTERHFDANMRPFGRRIEKIKARSDQALPQLGIHDRRFDVCHIDGGHRAVEVYSDGTLAWPLMRRGGIMIFDDYLWDEMPKRLDNPRPGIDAFLRSIRGQYRVVHRSYQIAIVKN
jgi:predicted O-methyltransferase YrrM